MRIILFIAFILSTQGCSTISDNDLEHQGFIDMYARDEADDFDLSEVTPKPRKKK